jgi:alpha/beta superfamily hydrolase
VALQGPAGSLEALLEEPGAAPRGAALFCHPHPLHGGTLHNKVVYRAAKGAVAAGLATLRFNFRGVGRSEGSHDGGRGEREDAAAALDLLAARHPGLPLLAAGFSFGAAVALAAAAADARVGARIGIGLPLRHASFDYLGGDARPLLLLHGAQDEFGPVDEVRALAARLGPTARLVVVDGVGHFFAGSLTRVTETVQDFCALWLRGVGPA